MTGRVRPASAPATSGIADRVEAQLDQVGVRGTASRRRRSSAVVAAVTVTHECRAWSVDSQKKSLFNREAEEAR